MKAQWLLLIGLIVPNITHTKWVEIKGAEKTPMEVSRPMTAAVFSIFGNRLAIGSKDNIWALVEGKPLKWENNKWVIKDRMKNPNEKGIFSSRIANLSICANLDGSVYIGVQDEPRKVLFAIYEWNGSAWSKVSEFNKGLVSTMDTIGKNNFVLLVDSIESQARTVYQGNGKEWRTLNNSKEDLYFPTSNISAGSDGTLYGIMFPITKEFVFDVARWNGTLWGRVKTPQFDTKNIPQKNLQILKDISVGNKNNIWLTQHFGIMGEPKELALYEKYSNEPFHIYKYNYTENKFEEISNEIDATSIYAGKDGITTWATSRDSKFYQWVEE